MLVNILDRGVVVSFDKVFFHGLVWVAAPFIDMFTGIYKVFKTRAALIDYMCQNYGPEVEKVLRPAEPARFPLMVIVNSKEVRDERERFVLPEGAVVDFLSPIAEG